MQVFIASFGTRGDIELFLTLGRELARRGHRVLFGAAPFYEPRIRAAGLTAVSLGHGTFDELRAALSQLGSVSIEHRPRLLAERWLKPQVSAALAQMQPLAQEIDYFISNLKVGLRRGGRAIPGAAVTYDPPDSLDDLRRPSGPAEERLRIDLVAMSRALVDPDRVWGADYCFTGFWQAPSDPIWQPPADLVRFLGEGPPPVVLSLGSMVAFETGRLAALLHEALGRIGGRAVVVEGWSSFPRTDPVDNRLFVAREIPYDWLFDKASCVIHHGGCGTLAAVLRAGRPSVLLPQLVCQQNFGKMLVRENLAAAVLDVDHLDAEYLAEALAKARNDERIRQAAANWQQRLAGERGVAEAAELIERHWQEIQQATAP
jgi:UDP:flavonoid glycosyltransferase YjiC (YdhE family)